MMALVATVISIRHCHLGSIFKYSSVPADFTNKKSRTSKTEMCKIVMLIYIQSINDISWQTQDVQIRQFFPKFSEGRVVSWIVYQQILDMPTIYAKPYCVHFKPIPYKSAFVNNTHEMKVSLTWAMYNFAS